MVSSSGPPVGLTIFMVWALILGLGGSPEATAALAAAAGPGVAVTPLQSFFNDRELYDAAFARSPQVTRQRAIAAILPHHFLARDLIAATVAGLDLRGVERLIIVGPDHFSPPAASRHPACTTFLPWQTPYGRFEPDRDFLEGLLRRAEVAIDDRAFRREHSIYILVPFLKKAFPQARVVPLILRRQSDLGPFMVLGRNLRDLAPERSLLVVSTDFAHERDLERVDLLDRESLAHLERLSAAGLTRIHCDCRTGLAVLRGFLGEATPPFSLAARRTSRDFQADDDGRVTSYIAGYYLKPVRPVKLLFLGDLMLDRRLRRTMERLGGDFPIRHLITLLAENDLAIANLEGPFTGNPSPSLNSQASAKAHYTFTFDPALARTLKEHRLNVVHLGNNHILDFGAAGLQETKEHLTAAGIEFFGDPGNGARVLVKDLHGLKLGLVSYNQFHQDGVDRTLRDLERVRPAVDLLILYAHWGVEYRDRPPEGLRNLARTFIDRGADLVVGSHPHVIQEKEAYGGKMIYYSLGNFIFDQYHRPDTRRGLALRVTIHPGATTPAIEEIFLQLERSGQTIVDPKN